MKKANVLEGLRVVEFAQLIAAPFCGLTLADLGADVIKVEPPVGDYTRTLEPYLAPGRSGYFQMLNRGKRSIALDLRADGARELVAALVHGADIVVEGLGEAAGALGIDHATASARNPALIWCSVTGLGRESAGRAIDPNLQAAMGIMATTGEAGRPPARVQLPLIDFMTAMYATQCVLVSVMSGEGALHDCAMIDAAATLTSSLGVYALGGETPVGRIGAESYWYVPAGNFEAADGEWLQLVAMSERHWRAICTALGYDEWVQRFPDNAKRVEQREVVHGLIAEAIRLRPAAEWAREIAAAGGLCQRIRSMEEAWTDPLLAARGLLGTVTEPSLRTFPVPVTSFAGRGRTSLAPAPALGEHSREVAVEAGLADGEVERLISTGALVTPPR